MSKVPGKKKPDIVEHNKKRQCKDCGDTLRSKHEHKRCDSCHRKHRHHKRCEGEKPQFDVLRFTPDSLQQLSTLLQTLDPITLPALALNLDEAASVVNPPTFAFPGVGVEAPIAIPLPFVTMNAVSDSSAELIANGYIASSATTTARMIAPRAGKYELTSSISMVNVDEAVDYSPDAVGYRLRIYRGIVPALIYTHAERVMLPSGMGTVTASMSNIVKMMAGDQWEYTLMFDSNPTSSLPFNWDVASYTNGAELVSE